MKTNKLPKSAWADSQEAGSQSQQTSQPRTFYLPKDKLSTDTAPQVGSASNDASYHKDEYSNHLAVDNSTYDSYFGYKSVKSSRTVSPESAMIKRSNINPNDVNAINAKPNEINTGYMKSNRHASDINNNANERTESANQYQKANHDKKVKNATELGVDGADIALPIQASVRNNMAEEQSDSLGSITKSNKSKLKNHTSSKLAESGATEIPERVFMNGLIKHTGIALAIIIPLAAFSAFAASPPITPPSAVATNDKTTIEALSVELSNIIHKSADTPTTVDSVDLKKYAGTWYEIGRLPMYFQRNCASDVTATYVEKIDGSGIKVINQCKAEDGSGITAEGLAKPADATGSKLKVTFLPSWIRWLPVGRADYWVLARDPDYKTALVGTPNKKYLWLLARSPNVSQETYAKYRQIAQQQGYDLKEFKLTAQTNQTVNLIP